MESLGPDEPCGEENKGAKGDALTHGLSLFEKPAQEIFEGAGNFCKDERHTKCLALKYHKNTMNGPVCQLWDAILRTLDKITKKCYDLQF